MRKSLEPVIVDVDLGGLVPLGDEVDLRLSLVQSLLGQKPPENWKGSDCDC